MRCKRLRLGWDSKAMNVGRVFFSFSGSEVALEQRQNVVFYQKATRFDGTLPKISDL